MEGLRADDPQGRVGERGALPVDEARADVVGQVEDHEQASSGALEPLLGHAGTLIAAAATNPARFAAPVIWPDEQPRSRSLPCTGILCQVILLPESRGSAKSYAVIGVVIVLVLVGFVVRRVKRRDRPEQDR